MCLLISLETTYKMIYKDEYAAKEAGPHNEAMYRHAGQTRTAVGC